MVCLAEAPKIGGVVGPRWHDVVYLIPRQAAVGAITEAPLAEPAIALSNLPPQGLPVCRKALLAVGGVPVRLLGAPGR